MRWTVLVALVGCGKAPSPNPDAAPVCSGTAVTAAICADFDEDAAIAWEHGVMVPLPNAPAMVTVSRVAPFVSPPNALWIDSQGGSYGIGDMLNVATVTQLTATFALAVTRAGEQDASLSELRVRAVALDCYVELYIKADPIMPALWARSACDTTEDMEVLGALPTTLTPVTMTLDAKGGTATVQVQDASVVLPLGAMNLTVGSPQASVGVSTSGGVGPAVGFDNVIVFAQ